MITFTESRIERRSSSDSELRCRHGLTVQFWRREVLNIDTKGVTTHVLAGIQILVQNVEYVVVKLLEPAYSIDHFVKILSQSQTHRIY
jgi:hypothetical protein